SKRDSVYFSLTDTETDPPVMTPKGYKLYHNYPNPFNPVTKIKFRIEAENEVILRVYNVEGEIVSVLENGILPAGEYEREFSPKSRGTLEDLSSGVYFYRLIVRDNNKRPVFMDAGKMVMVK
ncbi:MAG: T9SS type A sorting domain-containing protein, partial [Ignavibacteriaceae bacterium]|nr:T9SS type A sorting domain-containing protein [Ignavibacteriaceae bacterium]